MQFLIFQPPPPFMSIYYWEHSGVNRGFIHILSHVCDPLWLHSRALGTEDSPAEVISIGMNSGLYLRGVLSQISFLSLLLKLLWFFCQTCHQISAIQPFLDYVLLILAVRTWVSCFHLLLHGLFVKFRHWLWDLEK